MDTNGRFCRMCGTELKTRETEHEGMVPYCPSCEEFRFPQYNNAVSMIDSHLSDDEQIQRISRYERMLEQAEILIRKEDRSESETERLKNLIGELESYYGSDEWKKDYADDENGLLPEELKRGVLSEDGIYNLRDHVEANDVI